MAACALRYWAIHECRPRPIRLLHLEDSEPDHALAMAYLRRGGMELEAGASRPGPKFRRAGAALGRGAVRLQPAGFPAWKRCNCCARMACRRRLVPFILVSGQIGEDTAVEAMRNGASDYLLKNNLARLAPAVEHAIARPRRPPRPPRPTANWNVSRQRLSELAQHLQTSVEAERRPSRARSTTTWAAR
jgi:DNA-binding NtrC family response regulator